MPVSTRPRRPEIAHGQRQATGALSRWHENRQRERRARAKLDSYLGGYRRSECAELPCRSQAAQRGATTFSRTEGIIWDGTELWFVCTNGGPIGAGQIFRYNPEDQHACPRRAGNGPLGALHARQPAPLRLGATSCSPRTTHGPAAAAPISTRILTARGPRSQRGLQPPQRAARD